VGSPDRTIGAAYTQNTPTTAAIAHHSTRRSRHGSDSPRPTAASATTSGAVSSAVASAMVVKPATTMIAASPTPGTSMPGSSIPATRSTNRPQPKDSAMSSAGNPSQHTSIVTGLTFAPPAVFPLSA
jgi:hypothetical protein